MSKVVFSKINQVAQIARVGKGTDRRLDRVALVKKDRILAVKIALANP